MSYTQVESLKEKLANPDPSSFNACQQHIFDLMKYDTMIKFKATPGYKEAKSKSSCDKANISRDREKTKKNDAPLMFLVNIASSTCVVNQFAG